MRIVHVHYHLQTGGVTTVMDSAQRALASDHTSMAVISGEACPDPGRFRRQAVVPGLRYDAGGSPGKLAAELRSAARNALGGDPDVWHFHNHCLGKNRVLPLAIRLLAEAGQRLLLQIHDFPEDGRPGNYDILVKELGDGDAGRAQALLYPAGQQVHYAVLNARDRDFLARAGLPAERLWLLPNAVILPGSVDPEPAPCGQLWLYPTRAIRRKNLGEFLLWSSLAEPGQRFGTTRAPENPAEQQRYRRWVRTARELDLPVDFELGSRRDFPSLVASARCLVTTSVAEGFGLAFLEPWLANRPVAGRDLPNITADFKAEGVNLEGLYQRLDVPLDWVGRSELERRCRRAIDAYFGAYGRIPPDDALATALEAWTSHDRVDFGRLDEDLQERVLRRAAADPEQLRKSLTVDLKPDTAALADNRRVICRAYGLGAYGRRLAGIYASLCGTEPGPVSHLDGATLLDAFLEPARLRLLQSP